MTDQEVASPCISLCKIDELTQQCLGCDRTIEEITRWSTMDNHAKQIVIEKIVQRKKNRAEQ